MNSFLTSVLLTGNKLFNNNNLGGLSQSGSLTIEDSSFPAEFATLWQQLAVTGGKDLPVGNVTGIEFNPDVIEQLGERLELSPQEVLALPAPIIDVMSRALTQTNSMVPVTGMLPGDNKGQLLSTATLNDGQLDNPEETSELSVKLLPKREQFDQLLPRQTVEKISAQREPIDYDTVDTDFMRQLSLLKLVAGDAEQGLQGESLLRDVQQTRVIEQLTSVDKLNPATNVFSANAVQTSSSQQAFVQLPRVETPVGQAQWGQAVGERLMFMVNNKVQAASIILNPPELGPIEVKLNLNHDQASVHFVSNHAAVREAIEEAFPRLREMFAQSGLQLADANVSQQSSQQRDQQPDAPLAMRAFSDDVKADVSNENEDADVTAYVVNDGLVDHYV